MAEIKRSTGNVAITRSMNFMEVYSNGVNARVTENDIGLVFLRATASAGGVASNEEQVAITMSPQMFKIMTLTVLSMLNGYEKELGEIKLVNEPDLSQIQSIFTQMVRKPGQ